MRYEIENDRLKLVIDGPINWQTWIEILQYFREFRHEIFVATTTPQEDER